jgi:hypothetical protein
MTCNSKSNIKFNYLYRDAGNFKVWGCEVFSNPDLLELKTIEDRIRTALIDGEFFDPKKWGLKRLKHDDWIPELDHTWNEFESIEITNEAPTVDLTVTSFLNAISIASNY